jgi:NAD(P)-dependent dehydrogenase (short-subunit alcohol dehydrogenase family)
MTEIVKRGSRLSGKVAIVAGAGSQGEGIGIGRAISVLMAREGARVVLVDRVAQFAEVTAQMIRDEGGECRVVEADVGKPDACESVVNQTLKEWSQIDILVNNVGVPGPRGTAVEVDPVAWDETFHINVTTMMLMSKYVVPPMRAAGRGSIVHIASVAGLRGGTPHLVYPTTKGAVVNMTRAMAAHHGEQGIRVNCVAPGLVHTPFVTVRGMTDELREQRRNRSLLKTEGNGWDIGYAVVYLASDEARWVTGVILPVDAGVTSAVPTVRVMP